MFDDSWHSGATTYWVETLPLTAVSRGLGFRVHEGSMRGIMGMGCKPSDRYLPSPVNLQKRFCHYGCCCQY